MSADWSKGVEELVQAWQSDPQNARAAFLAYRDYLVGLENVSLEFKARPGVSYSLRNYASCSYKSLPQASFVLKKLKPKM